VGGFLKKKDYVTPPSYSPLVIHTPHPCHYVTHRGSHSPLSLRIGGGPLPYPPSPRGVFGWFRGVNPINEICGYFLRGVCVAEISEKIFGKFGYLLG